MEGKGDQTKTQSYPTLRIEIPSQNCSQPSLPLRHEVNPPQSAATILDESPISPSVPVSIRHPIPQSLKGLNLQSKADERRHIDIPPYIIQSLRFFIGADIGSMDITIKSPGFETTSQILS